MEMPESCYYCPFADGVWQKDKRCLINGKEMPRDGRDVQQNHINCPLVEVPTTHGDLISREWLVDIALHLMNTAKNDDIANGVKWLWQYIIEAPTIIPADDKDINVPNKEEGERWLNILTRKSY